MNRFAKNVVSLGIACTGLIGVMSFAASTGAAGDDEVMKADRAVVAALSKGDKAAANKWLDPDFTWIDSEGIMWAKDDAFRGGLKPLVPAGEDVKVVEHKYGKSVVWIQWNQGNKYSARFLGEAPRRLEAVTHHRNRRDAEARTSKLTKLRMISLATILARWSRTSP